MSSFILNQTMAKNKAPAIQEIEKQLKQNKLLPVYYLFGEDSYSIETAYKAIEKYVEPFITSDFDKESYYGENQTFVNIVGLASTFPFGSEKKLITLKQAEKPRDKKEILNYLKSPADFSVIIFLHDGTITNPETEPYKTLANQGFLFEAKELKGNALIEWVISTTEKKGKKITHDNAQLLTDISGENRNSLESQLDKIILYIGENKEITIDSIRGLSTSLKQYTIFDLQNAVGKKSKANALKVAYNLLENGSEPIQIIAMLNKYFTGLARLTELTASNTNEYQVARILGTHPFYLKDYHVARKLYSDKLLADVFSALLKADLAVKTTSIDDYTLISILIAEIIPD